MLYTYKNVVYKQINFKMQKIQYFFVTKIKRTGGHKAMILNLFCGKKMYIICTSLYVYS